jgi:ribosome maturation factor RimP
VSKVDKVRELIEPIIKANEAFIVDLEIHSGTRGKSLEIFIDTDDGISTETCAKISRLISKIIEDENIFSTKYQLIVSSPGLEKALKYFRQYRKNIGRRLNLKVTGNNQRENISGVLEKVTDDGIVIRMNEKEQNVILFSSIIEAVVETPW